MTKGLGMSFLTMMAIGDAFGMKYEFIKRERDIDEFDFQYGPHPTYTAYQTGCYTDDTQMSFANANLLRLNHDRLNQLTAKDFITAWVRAYKRDPRAGYSRYMDGVMSSAMNVKQFQAAIDAKRGVTGGACMRAIPFGYISDLNTVKKLTLMQAKITHDTPSGRTSALAIALSAWHLRQGGNLKDLNAFLSKELAPDWNSAKNGMDDSPNNGLRIASCALGALTHSKTMSEALLKAVNAENPSDTDTICALTMGLASLAKLENDLPEQLPNTLENGRYGRDFLMQLDQSFNTAFPIHKTPAKTPAVDSSVKSAKMGANVTTGDDPKVAGLTGYHAHVYFETGRASEIQAGTLRAAAQKYFAPGIAEKNVYVGRFHKKPVGPHTLPMFMIAFTPSVMNQVLPWLQLNAVGLNVLIHPETGDDLKDHRDFPFWFGKPQKIDFSKF